MSSLKNIPPTKILKKINGMMAHGEKLAIDRIMIDKFQTVPPIMKHEKFMDEITAVFIRYDGWILAAREKYVEEAYKTWEYEWICMIRLGFPRAIPLNTDKINAFTRTYEAREKRRKINEARAKRRKINDRQ